MNSAQRPFDAGKPAGLPWNVSDARIALWLFGFALAAAIAIGVGRSLVDQYGRRAIPAIVAGAVIAGALLGWALEGFYTYVQLAQSTRY